MIKTQCIHTQNIQTINLERKEGRMGEMVGCGLRDLQVKVISGS